MKMNHYEAAPLRPRDYRDTYTDPLRRRTHLRDRDYTG